MTSSFINADPVVHVRRELPKSKRRIRLALETNELLSDPVDAIEVFYHIKDINDPEHPYSLEQVCFSLTILLLSAFLHCKPDDDHPLVRSLTSLVLKIYACTVRRKSFRFTSHQLYLTAAWQHS